MPYMSNGRCQALTSSKHNRRGLDFGIDDDDFLQWWLSRDTLRLLLLFVLKGVVDDNDDDKDDRCVSPSTGWMLPLFKRHHSPRHAR